MTKTRRAVIRWGRGLLATAVVAVSLAGDGWADSFEDYAIEVSPGDPFDDIPDLRLKFSRCGP